MNRACTLVRLSLLAAALPLAAATTPLADAPQAPPPLTPIQAPIRETSPGRFELGPVRLDRPGRSVSFPAVLNMNEGVVEYLLVASFGKTHESVLRTEVAPYQVHLAMLLVGAQGAGTNAFPDAPEAPLPGDPVIIETAWTLDGKEQQRRGEELVQNRKTHSPAGRGPWVYNGSRMLEGSFVAQLDGSIVSLITDPNALVNNPRPGHEDDELWLVRSNGLPELDTPVTVTIRLLSSNRPPAAPRPAARPEAVPIQPAK